MSYTYTVIIADDYDPETEDFVTIVETVEFWPYVTHYSHWRGDYYNPPEDDLEWEWEFSVDEARMQHLLEAGYSLFDEDGVEIGDWWAYLDACADGLDLSSEIQDYIERHQPDGD